MTQNIEKVKISDLKIGPIRQQVLPEGFIVRVQKFKEILREVETMSLEESISNFMRDLHPENELIIWENIAHQYEMIVGKNPNLTLSEKKNVLGKLLTGD